MFGKEGLKQALNITEALFSGKIHKLSGEEVHQAFKGMDVYEVKSGNIVDVLSEAKVLSSKREIRDLIKANGLSLNGEKISDMHFELSKDQALVDDISILRRGKKTYFVLKHLD